MYLNDSVTSKINEFARFAEQMPGVVIIHHISDFSVVYMTANGLKLLGVTLQELIDMKTEYYPRFFNMEDMEDFLPKMRVLLDNNQPEESFSYFQQVKYAGKSDWTWHISAVRIFMWDDEGKPLLTITTAYPIDRMKHIGAKAERLLQENNFLKKNIKAFSTLSKREKDILKQVALGKTSIEIADALFISVETAQTHRRNIRNKLEISSAIDFAAYARAFDLI
ncbi:regulatory protein, luxR family [Mucilaginibacter pineti]|uniref:Regulatory protein, luxR family n=1 Tax=Mucilaginibacter pineti TaxID=1391627 RepID=A0A1G6T2W8_9SPHI|nr:helix-turn-helix transcriptional regulator [Mucilaginibacter pineti]SDD22886.1 regulatory protein, luxR family [Mucilaginibacter pineti]